MLLIINFIDFLLDIISDFICIFGFLIYLEIIEIKCFNLDLNLRKYIIQRGIKVEPSIELNEIVPESDEDIISQDIAYFNY